MAPAATVATAVASIIAGGSSYSGWSRSGTGGERWHLLCLERGSQHVHECSVIGYRFRTGEPILSQHIRPKTSLFAPRATSRTMRSRALSPSPHAYACFARPGVADFHAEMEWLQAQAAASVDELVPPPSTHSTHSARTHTHTHTAVASGKESKIASPS